MCIKITDIQKKRAGDVTITSNCSPFTGQEETLALKKKKRKKNSTKPSDGHLHSHFALTQNNLIGRRKKKRLFQIHLQKQTAVISDFGPS